MKPAISPITLERALFERRIYPVALRNHQRIAMAAITIKTQAIGTL
jgi:hypothetical protein